MPSAGEDHCHDCYWFGVAVGVWAGGAYFGGVSGADQAMRAWAEERSSSPGLAARGWSSSGRRGVGGAGAPGAVDRLGGGDDGSSRLRTSRREGRGSGNSRNDSYPKTVTTDVGKMGLRVPPEGAQGDGGEWVF